MKIGGNAIDIKIKDVEKNSQIKMFNPNPKKQVILYELLNKLLRHITHFMFKVYIV